MKEKRGKAVAGNLFHGLELGPRPPSRLWAVVEIEKGGKNKYEYDKERGLFRTDRVLYGAVYFPTDYGFLPQTWSVEEKDPLDVMVISTNASFTGCVVEVRPVGLFKMIDRGVRDDKVMTVAVRDPRFDHIKKMADLGPHFKKEVCDFWENYAKLQPQKRIKVLGWGSRQEAEVGVMAGHEAYKREFGN